MTVFAFATDYDVLEQAVERETEAERYERLRAWAIAHRPHSAAACPPDQHTGRPGQQLLREHAYLCYRCGRLFYPH